MGTNNINVEKSGDKHRYLWKTNKLILLLNLSLCLSENIHIK